MTDSALDFYEALASHYHLIFADWDRAIERQAAILDRVIQAHDGVPSRRLLDCACGIGTQALGLARRGYSVHATDLSPTAVARAAEEAGRLGITLTTGVADFRHLAEQVEGTFDIVLVCDNALPHLLTDADLRQAAASLYAMLNPDGLLLASIRDYDHLTQERPHATIPQVLGEAGARRIVFQVWDWNDNGTAYDLALYILQDTNSGLSIDRHTTRYRALLRADLNAALETAGFTSIRWQMPQDTGYYQPIVTARR